MLAPLTRTVLSALRKAQRIVRHAGRQFVVVVILLAFAASLAMIASSGAGEKLAVPCDRASGLFAPDKKDIAMQLVSAAENSSLCWKDHYEYIEYNVEDDPTANRGYTGGIVGFTSRTGDMLEVVERFKEILKLDFNSTNTSPCRDMTYVVFPDRRKSLATKNLRRLVPRIGRNSLLGNSLR